MSVSQYARNMSARSVPQTEALPGMVKNNGGGYSYGVDCWTRLDRFLILGCEGGTYYASERKLTIESAACVLECAKADMKRTVARIVEISESGRAPKNDPAIFALALLSAQTNSAEALAAVNQVCRIGTYFFQYIEAVTQFRGWGRGLRRAVANWYLSKDADALAYQVTKYRQRGGRSHRDNLRQSHPFPKTAGHKDVFQWMAQPEKWKASKRAGTRLLVTFEEAQTATTKQLVKMIVEEGLVWEHIPTEKLNEVAIWEALLQNMPLTAMIRNLGKMSSIGMFKPLSNAENLVVQALGDQGRLKKARIHPFNALVASTTYNGGQGIKGSLKWDVNRNISAALEEAFYKAFDYVEPSGARVVYGVDCSASMTWHEINGTRITPRIAAACLAMVGLRCEPRTFVHGFCGDFVDLGMTKTDRLDAVVQKINNTRAGSTNVAVPVEYALKHGIEADAFVVLTDNETNSGKEHLTSCLERYRKKTGIKARLVVVGMEVNDFSSADPKDPLQMDICGFDSAAPSIIGDFIRQ